MMLQIECSNGQIGFGRRKREVPSMPPDPNKVFEVSITSFIKVDYKEGEISKKGLTPWSIIIFKPLFVYYYE